MIAIAPANALGAGGGTDRPLRWEPSGTGVLDLATGALTTKETSLISHVGRGRSEVTGTLTFTGPGTVAISGSFTTTAPTGDKLFVSSTGTGVIAPDGIVTEFTNTITGGTGRFSDASGTFTGTTESVVVSQSGTQLTYTTDGSYTGTISY